MTCPICNIRDYLTTKVYVMIVYTCPLIVGEFKGGLNMHILDINSFKGWEIEREMASAYGKGSDKGLYIYINEDGYKWKVYSKEKLIGTYNSLREAVEIYNKED